MKQGLRDPIIRHLTSQFHRPRGPLGVLVGRIMSGRGSNSQRNLWLIDLLELEPHSRVLEIGPGPGVALEAAARIATAGEFFVLDHSKTMLGQTAHRNRELVAQGRLFLHKGAASRIPATVTGFDRIYSMNVWQFWEDQEGIVLDLANRLNPGGILAIGYQPRHPGATAADADAARRCLIDQLADACLAEVSDHRLDLEPPVVAVLGRRSQH